MQAESDSEIVDADKYRLKWVRLRPTSNNIEASDIINDI